ncbi:MAG: phytanoyl-CoA hydroxylase, partial [Paracoccaceae bacterium]
AGWVNESRSHDGPFGAMQDGRPRFDVEPGHSASKPGLRRVGSPTEISQAHEDAAFDSPMADMVAALIGPNVRFHHAKVNSKLPGTKTTVKWHQDFTFDPHSNDDVLTALLFVDDVTAENGPLMVVPGSHSGPLYSLWQGGVFTGAVEEKVAVDLSAKAVSCIGAAGSVCLMNSRLAHASSFNRSPLARSLFIAAYAAADALPLAQNAVPSSHAGRIVRGVEPGRIRSTAFDIEMPELPKGASFFDQQSGAS